MQSGTMLCSWALGIPGWQRALLFTERLGKKTTDLKEAGEFLETVDASKIVDVSQTLLSTRVSISVINYLCTIRSPKDNTNATNKIVSIQAK